MSLSYDSNDDTFDDLSKKYIKSKSIDTSSSNYIQRLPHQALLNTNDLMKYYETSQNIISNTLNSIQTPQKRKNSTNRGGQSKRGRKSIVENIVSNVLSQLGASSYIDTIEGLDMFGVRTPNKSTRGRGRKTTGTRNSSRGRGRQNTGTSNTTKNSPRGRGRKTAVRSNAVANNSRGRGQTASNTLSGNSSSSSSCSAAVGSNAAANNSGRGRGRQCTRSTPTRNRQRGRGRRNMNVSNIYTENLGGIDINNIITVPRRHRSTSGRSQINIPTYNVGEADDYIDLLETIPLFSSQPTLTNEVIDLDDSEPENDISVDNVSVLNDSVIDENKEICVKVEWRSLDTVKFNIRRYQKLTDIYNHFSKQDKVDIDRILLVYDDKILRMDDTPDSIDYNIAKRIEGGLISNNIGLLRSKPAPQESSGVKIKFQYQKSRKPFEISVQKDEKLSTAMIKCAEHLELPLIRLKFEFDGDIIKGRDTVNSLDIDDEACIDVKIMT